MEVKEIDEVKEIKDWRTSQGVGIAEGGVENSRPTVPQNIYFVNYNYSTNKAFIMSKLRLRSNACAK